MKIKDIHIDGFGVWTDLAVDSLPDGMTLFYGPNEAGKTTLMQFIRACLYGFTPGRRQRYLPPVFGGTPGGGLRVTGPGGGYQIRRRVHGTQAENAEQSMMGQLTVTGQDGLAQGQHRLAMLLGQIDEPIFTNVFAIGLRELQELSTLDDTSAADELYKLSSGLDRVSLVDVMRSLRTARGKLVDARVDEPEAGRLATMLAEREKLKDEIGQLTARARRWSDLATQRRSQEQEITDLRGRLVDWERQARCVEVATSVQDNWANRQRLLEQAAEQADLRETPADAPEQLLQLEAQLEERKEKIEGIKKQRRELREKAAALPLSRRLVELQSKIEAASEQATWVEALEDQIEKLESQIERGRQALDEDAEKLGIEEEDRRSLVNSGRTSLPDLSRQTLATLTAPARAVKEQLYQLKRARDESLKYRKESESLSKRLHENLEHEQAENLHAAIKRQGEVITTLRQRMQIEEQLEKTRKHYRDLEQESLDLATSEALPIERTIMLAVPFAFGGISLIYGIFTLFGWDAFVYDSNPNTGIMLVFLGLMALGLWYLGRERGDQGTSLDLEDCERQIDTLRRQIRDLEAERDEIEERLPAANGSLDVRMREAEELQHRLESLLPTFHGQQAATERYRTARQRASQAAEGLKAARNQWRKAVQALGLSESMSPSRIRLLSDGYQTLLDSRRKLEELQEEREQRRRERAALAKRIETLYLEALGPEGSQDERNPIADDDDDYEDDYDAPVARGLSDSKRDRERNRSQQGNRERDRDNNRGRDDDRDRQKGRQRSREQDREAPPLSAPKLRTTPLDQLNHLHEELSRQQHWIKRRRELKEQDVHFHKQQAAHARTIQRLDGARRSLWAKCGVATAEQFYELLDAKQNYAELQNKIAEYDAQIRSMIGTQCAYEDVQRELDGAKPADLQRRWDALTERISQTEERIAGLQTRQGELAQEMRSLAEDERLSFAQLELECIERKLESLAHRWQMLAMSSCLLEDVCATFEKERQPETLREASTFLAQLTDGKYVRIWTPLGTNELKIDSPEKGSLPIEVLSRGTREAVFIALRLALAAAYARRGVMLPLVLDDVLVNFDRKRAIDAALTLKTFAELGHQVMMFTCHDHIASIFHDIDVQVRLLPTQGQPGIAEIMPPPEPVAEEYEEESYEDAYEEEVAVEEEEEPELIEPEAEPEPAPKPEPEPLRRRVTPIALPVVERPPVVPLPVVEVPVVEPPQPVVTVEPAPVSPPPPPPVPEPRLRIEPPAEEFVEEELVEEELVEEEVFEEELPEDEDQEELDWVWYQRGVGSEWLEDSSDTDAAPPEVWQRPNAWWSATADPAGENAGR